MFGAPHYSLSYSRSGSFAYMDVGKGREQERKLCLPVNNASHNLQAKPALHP